jgi:hypothetical protein
VEAGAAPFIDCNYIAPSSLPCCRYVEHVFEELDYPREFFFDVSTQVGAQPGVSRALLVEAVGGILWRVGEPPSPSAPVQTLYYFHNATAGTPPPASWTFEAPLTPCLFNLSGSPAAPVTGVSFTGLTFTSVAASYLGPHGIPSGGDWGLSRMGAILAEGTQVRAAAAVTGSEYDGRPVMYVAMYMSMNTHTPCRRPSCAGADGSELHLLAHRRQRRLPQRLGPRHDH